MNETAYTAIQVSLHVRHDMKIQTKSTDNTDKEHYHLKVLQFEG